MTQALRCRQERKHSKSRSVLSIPAPVGKSVRTPRLSMVGRVPVSTAGRRLTISRLSVHLSGSLNPDASVAVCALVCSTPLPIGLAVITQLDIEGEGLICALLTRCLSAVSSVLSPDGLPASQSPSAEPLPGILTDFNPVLAEVVELTAGWLSCFCCGPTWPVSVTALASSGADDL